MKKLYHNVGAVLLFCLYIAGAVVLRFYAVTDVNKRRVSVWWTSKICRMGSALLNINVKSAQAPLKGRKGRLIISNHMSYLDILIYSSVHPAVFISSVEVEQTFFLGFVARIGGTFFVERRNPKNIRQELNSIKDIIDQGMDVVLFPEGTSTDGSKILPFRSSLLAGAVESGVEIVPACIRYEKINGKAFSDENRDLVCWYGDMTFAGHFFTFTSQQSTEASVTYLAPVDVCHDRKTAARIARDMILSVYFGAA